MAKVPVRLDKNIVKNLISSLDNFLFDCDGVLYRGGHVVEGAPKVVHKLVSMGKKVFYVTNSSSKSRTVAANKLTSLGYPAKPTDIVTSAYVTACHVSKARKGATVFVLGDVGLQDELKEQGLSVVLPQENFKATTTIERLQEYKQDPNVSCVVVGLTEEMNYLKVYQAMSYLYHTDLLFVSTNKDPNFPGANGKTFPGGGSVCAMVATASERPPDVTCGKPGHVMADVIKNVHDVDFSRSIMIGDRLDTDMEFGVSNGMKTLLVLTGGSTQDTINSFSSSSSSKPPPTIPDFFLPSIADLFSLL